MKRYLPLLALLLAPPATGAASYYTLLTLRGGKPAPVAPAAGDGGAKPATLRVEGGKIAVQIYRPRRIDTLVTDLSVEVPAAEAALLKAPLGQARLRDRALQVLFDAAETPAFRDAPVTPPLVAETLARGLGPAAPGLASASVAYAVTSSAPRR